MLKQSAKAKNSGLQEALQKMEHEDPDQFLEHLENFANEHLVYKQKNILSLSLTVTVSFYNIFQTKTHKL